MNSKQRRPWKPWLVTTLFAVVILLPAMYGFGKKFLEFLILYRSDQGAYALVPILNYLLASLGFFFVLVWATMRGMFRDIEKPKFTMLEDEQRLDQAEEQGKASASHA
jgi:hypothetical protein